MQYLFNCYGDIVDLEIPTEDARFVLPYCFKSNIIMGLDCRQLERMIISFTKGYLSKIQELKEFGERLTEIVYESVPYLIPNLEKTEENLETSSQDKADEILEDLEKKDKDAKNKIMQIILHKDERRELEQTSFTFQIPISLSILTHLTRHRMHSLLVPEFLPMWNFNNYVTPQKIKDNDKALEIYEKAIKENMKVYEEFKDEVYDEDLIYFYVGAQMLNVMTTMNSRNLQWISRMRCCNKAQWQIRQIAWGMVNEAKKVAPLLGKGLGPTCMTDKYCGEGKESCGLINKILENS